MKNFTNSLISDSDMFNDEIDDDVNDDNDDSFENLIPEEDEEREDNDQLSKNESNLLVEDLININNIDEDEEVEIEEVDHGESDFNINEIIAKARQLNKTNSSNST